MIGDILFFIKCLVMTFIVVILLQVKIGNMTLEERTKNWAAESSLVAPLEDVAKGGVKGIREAWKSLTGNFSKKIKNQFENNNVPGQRTLGVKLERSKKYISEKMEQAQEKAIESLENRRAENKETLEE